MKENKNLSPRMVLFDEEEEYLLKMSDYLREQSGLPWKTFAYSSREEFLDAERDESCELLVVAENSYDEEVKNISTKKILILRECGLFSQTDIQMVDKYQPAENVLNCILELFMEIDGHKIAVLPGGRMAKCIGIYSPVHRCLQTGFAITMAQLLSRRAKTLYITFEHYAGIADLIPEFDERDLADLLYFLNAEEQKFKMRLQTIVRRKGDLDYIPPMKSGQNLLSISGAEWKSLLLKLDSLGEYEYIVLDLSESMQGLFEVLRNCSRVYTIVKKDRYALTKMQQYEQLLSLYEYEDVLDKTRKCEIPQISHFPEDLDQYTRGELAEYMKTIIRNMEEERF